ncbi:hypothetical protein B0H16DRAFT_1461130 [Mycena metata]|uniref:DUF6535 domain-containing protein n=1 Tax=Mycena metata TaxID=1033252 RepID=A0AAD7N7W7_9AGAR|nr:hypothetical protein B0H16DRAFT_1461130 [Mycena metata]
MADLSPIPPLIPPEAAASAIDGSGVGAAEELAPEETTNSESQPPVNPQAAAGPGAEEQLRRIVGAIEEQSASLTKTIDAGRPQIQSTDKKIAFWTAYKGLAYEFDREFQAKHGGDLDTALIFIQPEFQPDPNAGTQALLALLVHNVTGIAIPLAAPAGAPSAVIVAQSFLYASLFSTLLAALLAVLGKQWLLYYDSAGEKGTIEQRGIERQKKFSGIQRWKFGIVMQLCPLLIQFSLLLFAVALSLYLWTIHHTLAGIALASTALGSILYTIMIILAGVFPDSPFQTPLAGLLQNLIQGISFHGPIYKLWARQWETFSTTLDHVHTSFSETVSGVNNLIPLLPIFANSDPEPGTPDPEPMFPPPPPPSPQTLAIVWTLETSTDPTVVEAAAALVSEFQWWSLPFDVEPAMTRLKDTNILTVPPVVSGPLECLH